MTRRTDARGMLAEEPFAYVCRKDGTVSISWQGKPVMTLRGKDAGRFLGKLAGADTQQAQLVMAKATGNFKRGNEKLAKR